MDNVIKNTIFPILDSLNKNNLLKEKTELIYTCEGEEIKKNKCSKEEKEITSFLCEIKIEDSEEILIIKEQHNYFFEAHSIIIGDKTQILKGKSEKNKKIYFFEKELFKILEKELKLKEISQANPQYLNKKRFSFPYKTIPQIKEIQKYSLENLNVNLKNIQLVNHNKIELFLPTLNHKHNKIAHTLNIPIISLKKDNYFNDTSIHYKDLELHKKIIKPLLIIKEKKEILIYNKKKVTLELKKRLYLKVDIQKIKKVLTNIEKTNIDLEEFLLNIGQKKEILFGTEKGNIILPLFKKDMFKTFQNIEEFKQETGVEYKEDSNYLNSIYIQKSGNEKYIFKKYYLNKQLEEYFKSQYNKEICYNNEQAILLLSWRENTTSLFIEENIPKSKVKELIKHIFSLAKYSILESVKRNKLPKEKRAETSIEHFLLSTYSQIEKNLKEYEKNKNKNKLLKETLHSIQSISELKKTITIKSEENYFHYQCILSYLKVLKIFNKEKEETISNLLKEYYGEIKLRPMLSKINTENDNIIKDIIKTIKISNKKNTFILIKKEIYGTIIPRNIPKLPGETIFSKTYFKANTHKLKSIAPYSYKEIKKKINGTILPKTISINKKTIPCEPKYYSITRFHNSYKEIISNKVFSLFVDQKEKTRKPESSSISSQNFA